MTSMVFHGDRTTKLRSLKPFEPLPPMTHFKNGKRTPAISRIEVKVFSKMSPATYDSERKLGFECQNTCTSYTPWNRKVWNKTRKDKDTEQKETKKRFI